MRRRTLSVESAIHTCGDANELVIFDCYQRRASRDGWARYFDDKGIRVWLALGIAIPAPALVVFLYALEPEMLKQLASMPYEKPMSMVLVVAFLLPALAAMFLLFIEPQLP